LISMVPSPHHKTRSTAAKKGRDCKAKALVRCWVFVDPLFKGVFYEKNAVNRVHASHWVLEAQQSGTFRLR